jgi:hypothetical protein
MRYKIEKKVLGIMWRSSTVRIHLSNCPEEDINEEVKKCSGRPRK